MNPTFDLTELLKYCACQDFDTLELDLITTLFEIMIEIGERKILSMNKFMHARDAMYELNPVLFKEVEKTRFDSPIGLLWHDPTNMTVKMFLDKLKDYLSTYRNEYCIQLEKELDKFPDRQGDVPTEEMTIYIGKFCKIFTTKMAPEILKSWEVLKVIQENNPEPNEGEKCIIT